VSCVPRSLGSGGCSSNRSDGQSHTFMSKKHAASVFWALSIEGYCSIFERSIQRQHQTDQLPTRVDGMEAADAVVAAVLVAQAAAPGMVVQGLRFVVERSLV
jgi:hypothetical protein